QAPRKSWHIPHPSRSSSIPVPWRASLSTVGLRLIELRSVASSALVPVLPESDRPDRATPSALKISGDSRHPSTLRAPQTTPPFPAPPPPGLGTHRRGELPPPPPAVARSAPKPPRRQEPPSGRGWRLSREQPRPEPASAVPRAGFVSIARAG